MSTGIGAGISPVFNLKPGSGAAPVCNDLYSVNFANVNGGSQSQWLVGSHGAAVSFGNAGIGDFSIAFWIYPTNLSTGANMRIMDFGLGSATPPNGRIQLHMNAGATQMIGTAKVTDTATDQSSAFNPPLNTWTHVVWTASRSATHLTGKWYVNGSFIGNTDVDSFPQATNALITPTTGNFFIGRSGATGMFEGSLNDFTIWNKELSAGEITEIMDVSTTDNCMNNLSFYSDLSHWWAMGDPNGQASYPTIIDQVGSLDMEMKGMSVSNITTNVPT